MKYSTKIILHITLAMLNLVVIAAHAQTENILKDVDDEKYYIGFNVVAPFTGIRTSFTSGYLPAAANLETGFAAFVGKIWNTNYNVETRVSFGSPKIDFTHFVVQSGGMYCFNSKRKGLNPYTGLFFKLEALSDKANKNDYLSAIGYFSIGNRFKLKRFFVDLRLSENLAAISWANLPEHKTQFGFHESIYRWKSPYVPFGVINVGYFF